MSFNWMAATDDQLLAKEEASGGDLLSPHWIREKGLRTDRPDVTPYDERDVAFRAAQGEREEVLNALAVANDGTTRLQAEFINPAADALSSQHALTVQTAADLRSGRISIGEAAKVLEQHQAEVARIEELQESWRSLNATYQEVAADPHGFLEGLFRRYPSLGQHRRGL